MTAALTLRAIRKRFGQTIALDGVDLEVRPGSLHALLGENGAGKSTLMRIAYGMTRAEGGTMAVAGAPFDPRDPRDARRAGIGMVHQHFTTIAALTVWENVTLGAGWPLAGGRPRAGAALAARGVTLDVDRPAGDLTVGARQQLEVQKALAAGPGVLLLDEPTGVLTPPEVAELFRVVAEFTRAGGAVVLITHKLDEALEHADAITVLRRGAVTLSWSGTDQAPRPGRADLLIAMLGEGRDVPGRPAPPAEAGEVVATIGALELRAGEVVGIAGVEGNGQRELLRAIDTTAFIPEDRTTEGLIGDLTLTENLALRPAEEPARPSDWLVDWPALRRRMAELIDEFGIRTTGPDARAHALSGGNQQKVVVARALEGRPRVIVAENPARGLDVRAAEEIFARLRRAAADGAAVVFHSTDLDEVITWADRVLVMAAGELRVPPAGADRGTVGALMVAAKGTP